MRHGWLILAPALLAAAPVTDPQAEVRAALGASVAGWNANDLDRFLAAYADDAIFVTGKGPVSGRAAIGEHYRAGFGAGGPVGRGRLAIDPVALRTLSKVHVILWARWTLTGGDKSEAGYTTLVWERRPEGWRIISDHSG